MSAELILAIVGAALILLAIGGSIKVGDSAAELINAKLRLPLGIVGVLLIIFAGYSFGSLTQLSQLEQPTEGETLQVEYPIERVQVLSPIEGSSVDCRILTLGVYPEGHDKDIWVLLKPTDNRYYPQSDLTNTSYKRNGEWQVITRFGGDKDEAFEVIVYEADAAASEFFSSTIENWRAVDEYPGLEETEIPAGAQEVDRMVVTLQENCRGAHSITSGI